MTIKTAFVASTLPARFLLDSWEKLKITRLVCGSESLILSFNYLKEKFPALELVTLPAVINERSEFLLQEVLKSKSGIVTFHECCWPDLDLAILKVQPVVEYFPCVTLDSWRKLDSKELGYGNLLLKVLNEKTRSSLRLFVQATLHKNKFDFYEVPDDNGFGSKSYQMSLKESEVQQLKKGCGCIDSKNCSQDKITDSDSKNIILIVATDVIENKIQEKVFYQVAEICRKNGYNLMVKDHPNPAARLNLNEITNVISPFIPFEVIPETYRYKIGLFSTALSYQPERSISIAHLFSPYPDEFHDRQKHLISLPGGENIKFIRSIESLDNLLKDNGRVNNA